MYSIQKIHVAIEQLQPGSYPEKSYWVHQTSFWIISENKALQKIISKFYRKIYHGNDVYTFVYGINGRYYALLLCHHGQFVKRTVSDIRYCKTWYRVFKQYMYQENDVTHMYWRFYCTEEFPFIKRGEGVLKEVFFNELRNCVKFQRYTKEVRNVEFKQINFNLCFILLILNNARCNGVHLI